MTADGFGNRAQHFSSLGYSAVEVNQAEATRFIAGVHWVKRVEVQPLGATRESAPRPLRQIARSYRNTDPQANRSESCLEFAENEAVREPVGSRAGKIQARTMAYRVQPNRRRVLRIG